MFLFRRVGHELACEPVEIPVKAVLGSGAHACDDAREAAPEHGVRSREARLHGSGGSGYEQIKRGAVERHVYSNG